MSSSSINDRKSPILQDLVNMAEDIAERFREGMNAWESKKFFWYQIRRPYKRLRVRGYGNQYTYVHYCRSRE